MIRISVLLIVFTFFGCGSNTDKLKEDAEGNTATEKLTDEQLLNVVEKETFKYFWDYAEPNSGLGRERYHPDGVYPENDS
ncbi:beta-glucosidase, partial [Flavobacterium sp. LBUM151]